MARTWKRPKSFPFIREQWSYRSEDAALKTIRVALDHYGIKGGMDDPRAGWRLAIALLGDLSGYDESVEKRIKKRKPFRPASLDRASRDLALLITGMAAEAHREVSPSQRANVKKAIFDFADKVGDKRETAKARYYELRRHILRWGKIPESMRRAGDYFKRELTNAPANSATDKLFSMFLDDALAGRWPRFAHQTRTRRVGSRAQKKARDSLLRFV